MDKNGVEMSRSIQLHCDLSVDPRRDAEMVEYFETVYRPSAMPFEGYIDLCLLKLSAVLAGSSPPGLSYRFSITFESEALRQVWVASAVHDEVWGALQGYLASYDFTFLLFDVI